MNRDQIPILFPACETATQGNHPKFLGYPIAGKSAWEKFDWFQAIAPDAPAFTRFWCKCPKTSLALNSPVAGLTRVGNEGLVRWRGSQIKLYPA